MIYLCKRNKTGICIDRVYGYDTIVELPYMLEGFPVTELGGVYFFGPYRFDRIKNDAGKRKFLHRERQGDTT